MKKQNAEDGRRAHAVHARKGSLGKLCVHCGLKVDSLEFAHVVFSRGPVDGPEEYQCVNVIESAGQKLRALDDFADGIWAGDVEIQAVM